MRASPRRVGDRERHRDLGRGELAGARSLRSLRGPLRGAPGPAPHTDAGQLRRGAPPAKGLPPARPVLPRRADPPGADPGSGGLLRARRDRRPRAPGDRVRTGPATREAAMSTRTVEYDVGRNPENGAGRHPGRESHRALRRAGAGAGVADHAGQRRAAASGHARGAQAGGRARRRDRGQRGAPARVPAFVVREAGRVPHLEPDHPAHGPHGLPRAADLQLRVRHGGREADGDRGDRTAAASPA